MVGILLQSPCVLNRGGGDVGSPADALVEELSLSQLGRNSADMGSTQTRRF